MALDADGPSLRRIVTELAVQEATGRLVVADARGTRGWIWLRDGAVNGASGPGPKPLLANRLRAFGVLTPQRIRKAMAEAAETTGRVLLDVVVDLVPASFLSDFMHAALAEQIRFIEALGTGRVRFFNGEVTTSGPTVVATDALFELAERLRVTPERFSESDVFIADGTAATLEDPLPKVVAAVCDGNRSLQPIANISGLTRHETIATLEQLLDTGRIGIRDAVGPWEVQQPYPGGTEPGGSPADDAATDEGTPAPAEELQEAVADILAGTGGEDTTATQPDAVSATGPAARQAPPAPGRRPATTEKESPREGQRRRVDPGSRRRALSELSALGEDGQPEEPGGAAQTEAATPKDEAPARAEAEVDESRYAEPKVVTDPREASDLMRQLRELTGEDDQQET